MGSADRARDRLVRPWLIRKRKGKGGHNEPQRRSRWRPGAGSWSAEPEPPAGRLLEKRDKLRDEVWERRTRPPSFFSRPIMKGFRVLLGYAPFFHADRFPAGLLCHSHRPVVGHFAPLDCVVAGKLCSKAQVCLRRLVRTSFSRGIPSTTR